MKTIAYDVETTGLHPHHGDEMFAYSTCNTKGKTFVQRIDGSPLRQLQGMKKLTKLWSNESAKHVAKVAHNLKFDLTFTEKALGRRLDNHVVHCTHKMSHILQNHHHNHSLDQLGWELAEYPRVDGKMRRMAKLCGGYHKVPEPKMDAYQRLDGERGMLLHMFMYPKIKANPKWLEVYQTEVDLIRTTMRMEERGIMISRKRTRQMIKNLEQTVDKLREDLFALVGRRFNPDADRELVRILFGQLGMPVNRRTAKTKQPSVDKHALMALREEFNHPILNMILQLRSYTKGITSLESYINLSVDNVLHPSINTCQAITARESISYPNLQNVQKTGVLLNPFPVAARACFRPRPGYVLLCIDYAGIEMRLLIHYSEDDRMMDCLVNGDGRVHALAAEVFYLNEYINATKSYKETLYGAAKNADFAMPYGAGARKIAQTLGLKGQAGLAAHKRHKKTFPKLDGLTSVFVEMVKADGYLTTVFGRRVHVPKNKAYIGTNYIIQNTAAGILKRAQNRVHKYNEEQTGGEVKILIPIHDEIVMEYPRAMLSELPEYIRDVRKLMIDFPQFKIPLEIEVDIATHSWEHKKRYHFAA